MSDTKRWISSSSKKRISDYTAMYTEATSHSSHPTGRLLTVWETNDTWSDCTRIRLHMLPFTAASSNDAGRHADWPESIHAAVKMSIIKFDLVTPSPLRKPASPCALTIVHGHGPRPDCVGYGERKAAAVSVQLFTEFKKAEEEKIIIW